MRLHLALHPPCPVAIVPASLPTVRDEREPLDVIPVLNRWVRGALAVIALGLVAVFAVAAWLNPYEPDGTPRRLETHLQLGLPPCTFRMLTGLPCPSCGMTTSFALLAHGDPANSLRANSVGTLLALYGLFLVPWAAACVVAGRVFLVRSLERLALWTVAVFLALMFARWLAVLCLAGRGGF